MAQGQNLSASQVQSAIAYNQGRFGAAFLRDIQARMGLPQTGVIDESFVRGVADWQESQLGGGQGDGKVGPATEGALNILLPEAQAAADAAKKAFQAGGTLFDSWSNDARDNNSNGLVDGDDPAEAKVQDGSHFSQLFTSFWVRTGTYTSGYQGRPTNSITINADQEIRGRFRYMVCADVVSEAYKAAKVMGHHHRVREIKETFRRIGHVWRRSEGYPSKYLPGDMICVFHGAEAHHAAGGHAGIIVEAQDTGGGANAPKVVELPGPSWEFSDGVYDPRAANDLKLKNWARHTFNHPTDQYLGRLLRSRLHH